MTAHWTARLRHLAAQERGSAEMAAQNLANAIWQHRL